MSDGSLEAFTRRLQLPFTDKDLLQQVFVHRSYLNEHRSFRLAHNERLEFLGDAVLELIVTEYLYANYENPEGELTNWRSALVRGEMLAKIAQELDMGPHLMLSKGEQQSTGKARQIILANAFEALIGAIHLDLGYDVARDFVERHLIRRLDDILEQRLYIDAKSDLQEKSQDQLGITPSYTVLKSEGPDHAKEFTVGVYLADREIGVGRGSSKQKAEQEAAANALQSWEDLK